MRGHEVWLESKDARINLCRFVQPCLRAQHIAQILLRFNECGLQIDRFGEMLDRLVRSAQAPEGLSDIVVKIGNVVVERNRSADEFDCKFVASRLHPKDAEQVQTIEVMRDGCQDLPIKTLGLRELAPLVTVDGLCKHLLDV